jgi:outer membrane protein
MKNSFLLTFLLIAFASQSQTKSNQNYNFSLQQAIEFATQNNYKSINASRDIESSKQKKWETTAMGLPQISGSVNYQNNIEIQKAAIPADFFGGPPGTFTAAAFGVKQNMFATVSVNQLIFDGSYIVALQASKVYLEYFVNAKKKSDVEIREMIINSYGSVLLAEESIKILESNKKILEKNYLEINQIFKNGLGEQESVEQISITLSTVNSNLKNVIRLREIGLQMLKINLGLDINDTLTLTDNLDLLSKSNIDIVPNGSEFDVKNNIDYKIISSLVTQKELLLKLEKAKALPSLGAVFNIGANTFGQQFTFFNSSQPWYNFSNVGVGLTVPIFSSFARRAKTAQAKIALEQTQTQQKEVEQMLNLGYRKAKSDFEFSVEEYETAKSNLNLAQRIEKKQQTKFKEGLSTSFEFSEAQRQLYAAQQTFLQSMVDIINKKAALEKLTSN